MTSQHSHSSTLCKVAYGRSKTTLLGSIEILNINVNGHERHSDSDPETSLLDVLRNDFHLTGAKYGCGEGNCGACSVLIEGEAVRSCITPSGSTVGREVITVEGLAGKDGLTPLQQAFVDHSAFQCGYCTPGFVISATALLKRNSDPTVDQIKSALGSHICRCGAYARIVKAVQQTSGNEVMDE